MRITRYMRRGSTCHHILCAFQGSPLHILTIIIEHFIGQMTARKEFADRKLWNKAIDKKPTFIAAQIIEFQRSQAACTIGCPNPTWESYFLRHLLKTGIVLCHFYSFRDKLCAFKQLSHDGLIFQRKRQQLTPHEHWARILTVSIIVSTPLHDFTLRLDKCIINVFLFH